MPASFRHLSPAARVYCGTDCLQNLTAELRRMECRRAVVFCGKTLAHHPLGLALVCAALEDRFAGAYTRVARHSPLAQVIAGAETLRQLNADAVIALGGGSAIVTARASSILLAEGPDIHRLCTQFPSGKPPLSPKLLHAKLPQLVIPSTPSTAIAKAGSAVLDQQLGRRLALFDPKTRAAAVFIHPDILLTASPQLAMGSSLQAFAAAVQGIESRIRDPFADALLIHALRLLGQFLPRLLQDPMDADVRVQLMVGALLAGQGSDYAPSGLASAMAHCVGARFEQENGVTSAVVLPHAMRFNAGVVGDRLALIAEALGKPRAGNVAATAYMAVAAVEELLAGLGTPRRLRDIAVTADALPQLAEDIAADWFLHQNPRRVNGAAEVVELLRAAW